LKYFFSYSNKENETNVITIIQCPPLSRPFKNTFLFHTSMLPLVTLFEDYSTYY